MPADPLTHNVAALVMLAGALVLAALAWHREPQCPKCAHCSNLKVEKARTEAEDRHTYEHRSHGRYPSKRDLYECHDVACPRNEALREQAKKGKM